MLADATRIIAAARIAARIAAAGIAARIVNAWITARITSRIAGAGIADARIIRGRI
jgi:hypothetical protein